MPYRQQRFVQLSDHDEPNWDVNVTYRDALIVKRYSLIMPKTSTRDQLANAAIGLAVYVRLEQNTDSIFVRKDHIYNAIRNADAYARARRFREEQERMQGARAARVQVNFDPPAPQHRPAWQDNRPPAVDAKQVAKELLRSIDPDLLAKVDRGVAFYFTSPTNHKYIWYPNSRAIVSLDEDAPKYVCIHSRDHAVETNTYDWAITMRTYILANESHWRKTANFHMEYNLRGTQKDYGELPTPPLGPNARES